MTLGFLFAALITSSSIGEITPAQFLSMRLKVANFTLFLGFLLLWRLCFASLGLYALGQPLVSRRRLPSIGAACTMGMLVVWPCGWLFHIDIVTPSFMLVFWASSYALVINFRLLLQMGFRVTGSNVSRLRNVVIAGTGPPALRIARNIERYPESGCRVVGFVDDEWSGMERFRATGHQLVADFKNFSAFVRDHVVDELVVALPMEAVRKHEKDLLEACQEHGVALRYLLSVLTGVDDGFLVQEEFKGDVLMTLQRGSIGGWPLVAKRSIDIVGSALLLVLIAPLMLGVSLLIRLTSPGPALFTQERIGLNKRRFRMFKFRSMEVNAEELIADLEHLNEVDGPAFKLTDDPRITRLGHILRSTSIDELPQLINVFKGEMSLVGPRPLPIRDFERFYADRHRRRFSVRPGMTGLWQVSGRSSTSFERWMELDLEYIDGWSLGRDLRILVRTIPAVVRGIGAT